MIEPFDYDKWLVQENAQAKIRAYDADTGEIIEDSTNEQEKNAVQTKGERF